MDRTEIKKHVRQIMDKECGTYDEKINKVVDFIIGGFTQRELDNKKTTKL